MPICKNNPKRSYKGNEPSPKGLGYCASGEKEGTKMKGKDGNMWIKSKGKWIKYGKSDKVDKNIHKGYKTYLTHCNFQKPFLVAVKNKNVKVYKIGDEFENQEYVWKHYYTKLVKEYNVKKVFIGKSLKNEMTLFSKGYGKKFDGNTVLLELPGNKYVYIGCNIYEFTGKDKILSYMSPVGNNNVPYPFAIGEENVYFMLDKVYVPLKYIEAVSKMEMTGLYPYFYEHLSSHSKKMNNVKIIK